MSLPELPDLLSKYGVNSIQNLELRYSTHGGRHLEIRTDDGSSFLVHTKEEAVILKDSGVRMSVVLRTLYWVYHHLVFST